MTDMTKICTKCNNELSLESYHKSKKGKFGRHSVCKDCVNKHQRENREYSDAQKESKRQYAKEYAREKRKQYPEKYREKNRQQRKNLPNEVKTQRLLMLKTYKRNNGTKAATQARRRAAQKQATPCWFATEKEVITTLYKKARDMNMEVDHIVPLNSDLVCGLHCLSNLQLLTPEDNNKKSNLFWPNMP